MRKSMAGVLGLGVATAAIVGIWRAYSARTRSAAGDQDWDSAPFPFPPVPRPVNVRPIHAPRETEPWTEPVDGMCPVSHPIKAKLTSGIYHMPGGMNYDRTRPDRCYVDAEAADRDGLRAAKL
ncbi:MAG: hypothetical protein JWL83_2272 [Actinomycetia bacterium]|nr:hypothetical protein [Actinomycetes bacterium]